MAESRTSPNPTLVWLRQDLRLRDNPALRAAFARFPWREDAAGLGAWQRGETGYPIVDAAMRELGATGWMHNRTRMVVVSFLTEGLRVHWLEGARWLWDTLVDADLANNTLSWQWAAGCGADAAPYFRVFNPRSRKASASTPTAATCAAGCRRSRRCPTATCTRPGRRRRARSRARGCSSGRTTRNRSSITPRRATNRPWTSRRFLYR